MPRTTHIRPTKTIRTIARARMLSFPLSMSVVHRDQERVRVAAHRHVLALGDAAVGDEAAVDGDGLRRRSSAVGVHTVPNDAARGIFVDLVVEKVCGTGQHSPRASRS